MKPNIINILILCTLAAACSKEEDPPADPRLAFVGNYQSNEHDTRGGVTGTESVAKTVHAGIDVAVKLSSGNPTALEMALKELVAEVIGTFPSTPFSVEFGDPQIALISGNSFELQSAEFTITGTAESYIGTLDAEGSITGNTLRLEYEISIPIQDNNFLIFRSNEVVELQKQ